MSKQAIKMTAICILLGLVFSVYGQKDSRYNAGWNLPFNEKAGDVNPQTGNLTISVNDLTLPGRAGMDFSFSRIWSLNQSNAFNMYRDPVDGSNKLSSHTIEEAGHLGVGWSTTMPYVWRDTSSGELVLTLFYGGNAYELDQSGLGVYNPEKSNILGYDLLDLRVYKSAGCSYADFTLYDMADLTSDYGVTDKAAARSSYQLLLKDNAQFWFREDGKLMMQQDRTGQD